MASPQIAPALGAGSKLIDDLSAPHPQSPLGTAWRLVTDTVMGGISQGQMRRELISQRTALRMTGQVQLDNNGGFIQMALPLTQDGTSFDASGFRGIEISVIGNGEAYNLHVRTRDLVHPWQSYRTEFTATSQWQSLRLPFEMFVAHRTQTLLDLTKLKRIGLVAIGRRFDADLALERIAFY